MTDRNYIILYVNNALKSAAFYEVLFQRQPVEASENFALFALDSGVMFGLWDKKDVEPQSSFSGTSSEVGFCLKDTAEVKATLAAWKAAGRQIIQELTTMDFGETFTGIDPDGHRLRFFSLHKD